MTQINQQLATELSITLPQVDATVALLDEGATVPFIARYRKDKTKGLDDAVLRDLEKRLVYLRDMHQRREKILDLLTQQNKLTDDLKARIDAASSKLELEDIYLPYRPRRTSKAQKARDAGLTELAATILNDEVSPTSVLEGFEPQGENAENYQTEAQQLEAMQYIIMDTWAQDLALLDNVRVAFAKVAHIKSQVANEEKREVGVNFKDYFDHTESLAKLPAHRLLAMLRGRQENVLTLKVILKEDGEDNVFIDKIINNFTLSATAPSERKDYLIETAKKLWLEKYRPHIEHRLLTEKRLAAEADAIEVFGENLRHLLMAAPAGGKVTLGVDPGIRHGVKLAVVDATGTLIEGAHGVVYPFAPDNKREAALAKLKALVETHQVEIVAIGNGTASRETDLLIAELKTLMQDAGSETKFTAVVVNEAGASVYSASELASQELGDVDVSIRGAVSIARRLQDPLSELVKVDPKAIGVGQYQHDVNQNNLSTKLDVVTQDCVNAVGVDVNTASPAILTHIAGLNSSVAQQIYGYRAEHGAFASREELKKVPRLGERTFEQAAGFLRIRSADNKLEATGVHPESYALVTQLLEKAGKTLDEVLGKADGLAGVNPADFATETQGEEAVRAVIAELEKPAHDPRPEFKTAQFAEGINAIKDLEEGMVLEGVITNVTHFGAFVDVGVHQDGLVHISELANTFVSDPMNLVKVGQIVKVRVLSADTERKRISFSMKTDTAGKSHNRATSQPRFKGKEDAGKAHSKGKPRNQNKSRGSSHSNRSQNKKDNTPKMGSLGALLAEAGLKKSGK